MHSFRPPARFDGYRILRLLGRGGMGSVYLANDQLLDRLVAIKFISGADPEPSARERFLVEARAIARLQHPNVVAIYRVGHVSGVPYLVSEYVEGRDLNSLPRPVPWRQAMTFGIGIARALAAAHRRGVLHRDIKPANVILTNDGDVKLLDFGIAKLLTGANSSMNSGPASARASLCSPSAPCDARTVSLPVPPPAVRISTKPENSPTGSIPCSAPPLQILNLPPSLTADGHVLGTPAYMAPEVRAGDPASFRSDVYSLGALLYFLCANRLPRFDRSHQQDGRVSLVPAVPLHDAAPDVDPAFASIIDRCLHPDPNVRFPSGNELRSALAQLTPEARLETIVDGNPYPGLRAFDPERAPMYFGRDSEIRCVLERLSSDGMVVIAADAGVGKSSLCRAGVLPRAQRWFGSKRVWSIVTMTAGGEPAREVAKSLAPLLRRPASEIEHSIVTDPAEVGRGLRANLGDGEGLVLFVDQLEELVTLCDDAVAASFAELLVWLANTHDSIRVLATARSDFLGRLATLPLLGDRLASALYFLHPLTPDRIREVIVAPARSQGVRFESQSMIDELVDSASEAEGGLPLLQFTLHALWQCKDPSATVITSDAFRSLGGARGALARHADQVITAMRPDVREAAKDLLRRLVTSRHTRARRSASDLGVRDPRADAALSALVAGRLVLACEGGSEVAYEIAHEALIHHWPAMIQVLAVDAETKAVRERLRAAVDEWVRLGRQRRALWSSHQLREARLLQRERLSSDEAAFLASSRRWWRARLGGAVAGAAAIVVALVGSYGAARHEGQVRRRQAIDLALFDAQRSLQAALQRTSEAKAARTRAWDRFDRNEADSETAWAEALALQTSAQPLLDAAERQFESALLLDASRSDLRDRFASLLLLRASIAESIHDEAARDRALERAALYDVSGARLRAWHQPRRVELRSSPPGARITVEAFMPEADGRWSPTGARLELPAGSYRATFVLPGYLTAHLPFEVRRDEDIEELVTLLPASQVPEGFVHIPAGRGWYGSDAGEGLRTGFFDAEPMHPVRTSSFLIARHETTYAEWIAFLRALPPGERSARAPRVDDGGFGGTLQLRELTDGTFSLRIRLGQRTHEAREGEALAIPARSRRQQVEWLKLPVTGVAAPDAVAFARWLDRSGAVPGARLCTEQEWERAARGADRRPYPHGGQLSPDDANIDRTYGKVVEAMAPDAVGSHPASCSPFGVDDMAGNAWEWTTHARDPARFVARGGSFFYDGQTARIENRETPEASFRDVSVGVRICADVDTRESSVTSRVSTPNRRGH